MTEPRAPEFVWATYSADSEPFELARLDAATGLRRGVVALSGAPADDARRIVVGGGLVWVASEQSMVHCVDAAAMRALGVTPAGPQLGQPAVCAGALWVPTGRDGGQLARVDARTRALTGGVPLGYPRECVAHAGALWVAHGPRVTRVDPRTMRAVETHDLGGFVVALTAGGGAVFAATRDEQPPGVRAVAPEGGLLWRLGGEDAPAMPVAPLTGQAVGLCVAGASVWVATAAALTRYALAGFAVAQRFDEAAHALTAVGDAVWALRAEYDDGDGESALVRYAAGEADVRVLSRGRFTALAAG